MSRDFSHRLFLPAALAAAVLVFPASGLHRAFALDAGAPAPGKAVAETPAASAGLSTAGDALTPVADPVPDTASGEQPADEVPLAETAAETLAAEPQEPAAAGWDWDSFGMADDGPTVRSRAESKRETGAMELPQGPRVGETAEPDFAARPVPAYALFPGAQAFSVIPSVRDRDMHPCANCHTWTKSDPTPRPLKKPHDNFALEHGLHGKGKFWCFTCHTLQGGSALRTLEGQELDFNEAYVLCSQCHVKEARDWAFGAHGKRVAVWQGERKVYNCTVCHYQHRPAIKPREPMPGPMMRQGLDRPDHWVPVAERTHSPSWQPVWERRTGAPPGEHGGMQ